MRRLVFVRQTLLGCSAAVACVLLAGCPDPGQSTIEASFRADVTQGPAPLQVTFEDLSSSSDSVINSWFWTFGDGQSSDQQNPIHTYEAEGSYTVTLRVGDGVKADEETRFDFVFVGEGQSNPSAAFQAVPSTGNAPLAVRFLDRSTPGSTPINSRLWDFGDGGTSTEQDPVHVYTRAGTYNVSLTVSNATGTDSVTQISTPVVVQPPL